MSSKKAIAADANEHEDTYKAVLAFFESGQTEVDKESLYKRLVEIHEERTVAFYQRKDKFGHAIDWENPEDERASYLGAG